MIGAPLANTIGKPPNSDGKASAGSATNGTYHSWGVPIPRRMMPPDRGNTSKVQPGFRAGIVRSSTTCSQPPSRASGISGGLPLRSHVHCSAAEYCGSDDTVACAINPGKALRPRAPPRPMGGSTLTGCRMFSAPRGSGGVYCFARNSSSRFIRGSSTKSSQPAERAAMAMGRIALTLTDA